MNETHFSPVNIAGKRSLIFLRLTMNKHVIIVVLKEMEVFK